MTDSQESLYEQLFPFSTVMRQRVVENFSGALLNERWTVGILNTPIVQMSDSIDGGFEIITDSAADSGAIGFGDISRQYDPNGCVFLSVTNYNSGTGASMVGLAREFETPEAVTNNMIHWQQSGTTTFFVVADGTVRNLTNIGRVPDSNFHLMKGELDGIDAKGSIDGVLETTQTSNIPLLSMQPFIFSKFGTATTTFNNSYFEAFNT